MRMQCQRDVVAGIAAETARMLFSYYFLSVISAPMLLTMACAAVALIYNGILRGMHKETTVLPPANLELALYRGCDLLLSFLAISNVDLTTYVLIQLLIISAMNALEQRMANKKTLWLCLVGFILFVRANELISLLDVAFAISSALLRLETQKLSAQYTKMTIVQADIVSDTLLCLILWLVTPTERDLFMNHVPDRKLLLATAALASLAFIFSRNVLSSTKQSPIITASLICGATSAILTSSGIPLLIILISLVMVAMAAYNRLDDEPLIDQHYNDIITPRIVQHKNNYATQKLTAVIVVTFALILVHVHSQTLTYENNINQTTMKKPVDEIQLIDFNDRSMSEGVRKQLRLQCLHTTRSMYIKQVSAMIKPNRSFTIFQYPDHWNLGDAFIYYGQTAMWHVYGQLFQRPPNVNDNVNALRLIISRQLDIRNGVLFMTGGGNMGDTYPEADTDRWQLINAIGDDNFLYKTELVMLPQSINYKSQARLDLAMKGYRHPNLTMMLRDNESVQFAKEKFLINKAIYVPDAAFMLGPLVPNADPVVDLFFLIRQDTESTISNKQTIIGFAKKANLTSEIWDFPVLGFPSAKISDQIVSNVSSMFPDRILYDAKDQSIEAMVAYRTQLGNSMLSRGHVIITDRLHASIMATLIDRPVVYIDNNYRKLTRVRSSLSDHIPECTDAVLNAYYAPNIEEAVKIAATIISKLKNQL